MTVDHLEILGGENVGQPRGSETDGSEHFIGKGFDDGDGVGGLVASVDPILGANGWSSRKSGSLDLGDGADDEQGTYDCPEYELHAYDGGGYLNVPEFVGVQYCYIPPNVIYMYHLQYLCTSPDVSIKVPFSAGFSSVGSVESVGPGVAPKSELHQEPH